MKAGWDVKALGEVCEAVSTGPFGSLLGKKDYLETGIPLVNPIDMVDGGICSASIKRVSSATAQRLSSYQMRSGDIVVARRGELGRCAKVTEEHHNWLCGTGSFFVRPSKLILTEYLELFIRSPTAQAIFESASTGATMPNINNKTLSNLPIPLPPLDEQKRIVEVLDAAFEGLTRARVHTETNLQNARELFESYRDELFGNAHNGWTEAPLSEFLAKITYGFTNPMPDADVGPLKITAKNVTNGRIEYESARSTTQEAFDTLLTEKSRPKIGDVLLTKDGTLGRTAVVDVDGICVNQSVAVLTPKPEILPTFLHELLSCRANQTSMIADAGGTTIKHLYITRVPNISVFVPKIAEQKKTLETLATFQVEARQLISHYRAKLADLDAIRQALLQKAFAGELT